MDSRVTPMRTGVKETHNQVKEEHTIPPIISLDAGPTIPSGDEQQLDAIQAIYGPILTFMKLGGLYFGDTSFKRLGRQPTIISKRKISVARIYCTAIVASHWCSFVMSIVSLCVEGSSVLENVYTLITFGMWHFLSAIVATTCLVVLPLNEGKRSRFETFVHNLIEIKVDLATLKLYSKRGLILAIFIFLASTLIIVAAFQLMPNLTIAFYKPYKDWDGFRIFCLVSVILNCIVWLLPTLIFCITCLVLERQFDCFCRRVFFLDSNQSLDITALKEEYQKLCETVSLADKIFSPLLLEVISVNIPLLCFNFHAVINPPKTSEGSSITFPIIGGAYWLLGSAAILCLITVFGSKVNEKVRKLKNNLTEFANVITKSNGTVKTDIHL